MNITLKQWFIYIMTVGLLTTSSLAMASWGDDDDDDYDRNRLTVCERTANKMLRSCRNEIKEEYLAVTAMCINLGDAEEREECFDEARTARSDDKKLCRDQRDARNNVCDILMEDRYDPESFLEPGNFVEEPDATNPYFSLQPGHTHVLRASGGDADEIVVVTVTDEVLTLFAEDEDGNPVDGVNCRLVVDIVLEVDNEGEFEAVEVTDDYYAQATNGDVHYCGEVARNFEDGLLVDLDGSFMAGRDLAKSGVLIKAVPAVDDAHRQEFLLGEAEDIIRYVSLNADQEEEYQGKPLINENYRCGGNCLKTEEFIPPEPDAGEFKYYIAGTGFVLGVALEGGEPNGERDELLCTGDSPGVVLDACKDEEDKVIIADDARDLLCELSPVAFCLE